MIQVNTVTKITTTQGATTKISLYQVDITSVNPFQQFAPNTSNNHSMTTICVQSVLGGQSA